MSARLRLSWLSVVTILPVGAWIVAHKALPIDWHGTVRSFSAIPFSRITASLAGSFVSFCMLGWLDVLASRVIVAKRVSVKRAAFAGAVSHAFSNTLGFPALTGSLIRYRVYASAGLGGGDIARIVTLAAFGVAMGFTVVTTLAMLWQPALAHGWGRPLGIWLGAALIAFLFWLRSTHRALHIARWTLAFPDSATAACQMAVGGVEMLAAIGALYVLLPSGSAPPFMDFVPIYVGAVVVGLISHVPGGLGVFETVVLAAFPASARPDALAAMLCYRLTYSVAPFSLACMGWIGFELRSFGQPKC